MLTIVADTCGPHDTPAGACATESNQVRCPIEKRHMHACRNSFLPAIADPNPAERDIAANINFFMNVPGTPERKPAFEDGVSNPVKYVEMRAEMGVIALSGNWPPLNNPCIGYNPTPIQALIRNASAKSAGA